MSVCDGPQLEGHGGRAGMHGRSDGHDEIHERSGRLTTIEGVAGGDDVDMCSHLMSGFCWAWFFPPGRPLL